MKVRKHSRPSDDQVKTPSEADEESAGGSASDVESDDDVDEMYEAVFGHKPKPGVTMADEVEAAEKARRGHPVHEEEEEE